LVSFLQASQPTFCARLSYPHARYMPRPCHLPSVPHPNNILWTVQIMKLLIMHFSPAPVTSSLLRSYSYRNEI
jgi:hypothetical protein